MTKHTGRTLTYMVISMNGEQVVRALLTFGGKTQQQARGKR